LLPGSLCTSGQKIKNSVSSPLKDKIRSWIIKPSRGHHLAFLDGVRAIAILMVIVCHTLYVNPEASRTVLFFGQLFLAGAMGVPVFFVLSGFVISLPFIESRMPGGKPVSLSNYTLRRAAKIIPPFYLSLLIFALYFGLKSGDAEYGISALKWAAGIPHFVQLPPKYILNGSYWSLIIEVQFYTILPLLFWMTRRMNNKTMLATIFLVLQIVPFVSRLIITHMYAGNPDLPFYMKRFPGSLSTFSWGILFAAIYAVKRDTWQNRTWTGIAGFCGIATLAAGLLLDPVAAYFGWFRHDEFLLSELLGLLSGLGTFLLLFFCFNPTSRTVKLLSSAPLMLMGLVSYEWFIFHQPVVFSFRTLVGSSHGHLSTYLLVVIPPVLLTLAFSIIVYRNFSMPIMQWARNRLASRPAP